MTAQLLPAEPLKRLPWTRRLAARLRRSWAPPTVVLAYHRVLPQPGRDPHRLAVSVAAFERRMVWLASNANFITPAELIEEVDRPRSVDPRDGRPRVMLTFDDGYVDNHRHALPVLQRLGLTATVFATSGLIGADRSFWWDLLERIHFAPAGGGRLQDYLADHTRLRGMPPALRDAELTDRARAAQVDTLAPDSDRPMRWEELRDWCAAGMEVGGHTRSHPLLSALTEDEIRREIIGCKLDIEAELGRPLRLFAYPYGSHDAFDERCERAADEAGFACAMANRAGQVRWARSRFALPRCIVRDSDAEEFATLFREWCRP
ncbi:MAG: polysaccharide deacetylase family protein [Planctomycetes bacterium]|nr:polysaccharide deacetylase family protein [Planctomycetota bacterium]